jgi:hypothetical protein
MTDANSNSNYYVKATVSQGEQEGYFHLAIEKTLERIDLSRFLKNPIMFYNHASDKGVIGKWKTVRCANI